MVKGFIFPIRLIWRPWTIRAFAAGVLIPEIDSLSFLGDRISGGGGCLFIRCPGGNIEKRSFITLNFDVPSRKKARHDH